MSHQGIIFSMVTFWYLQRGFATDK